MKKNVGGILIFSALLLVGCGVSGKDCATQADCGKSTNYHCVKDPGKSLGKCIEMRNEMDRMNKKFNLLGEKVLETP